MATHKNNKAVLLHYMPFVVGCLWLIVRHMPWGFNLSPSIGFDPLTAAEVSPWIAIAGDCASIGSLVATLVRLVRTSKKAA